MRILVLGGSGIIGGELCLHAASQGAEVVSVSRGLISDSLPKASPIQQVQLDVRDPKCLSSAFKGQVFDVVIDLLSFTAPQLEQNLEALGFYCEQYMFVSSATVYGDSIGGERLTEDSTMAEHVWTYPNRKQLCEEILRLRAIEFGCSYTIVRPYITYGRGRLPFGAWESNQILRRMRDGIPIVVGTEIASTFTTVTHTSDVARAMFSLMANPRAKGETFNVASEEARDWASIYKFVASELDSQLVIKEAPIWKIISHFPDLRGKIQDRTFSRLFDASKLREASPGFKFLVPMEQGYADALRTARSAYSVPVSWTFEGRIDRLIGEITIDPDSRKASVRPAGWKDRLRYFYGRHPSLLRTRTWLGKRVRGSLGKAYE